MSQTKVNMREIHQFTCNGKYPGLGCRSISRKIIAPYDRINQDKQLQYGRYNFVEHFHQENRKAMFILFGHEFTVCNPAENAKVGDGKGLTRSLAFTSPGVH